MLSPLPTRFVKNHHTTRHIYDMSIDRVSRQFLLAFIALGAFMLLAAQQAFAQATPNNEFDIKVPEGLERWDVLRGHYFGEQAIADGSAFLRLLTKTLCRSPACSVLTKKPQAGNAWKHGYVLTNTPTFEQSRLSPTVHYIWFLDLLRRLAVVQHPRLLTWQIHLPMLARCESSLTIS